MNDLKNGKIRIFFIFLDTIRVVWPSSAELWGFLIFYVASLCTINCIPTIKLMAISKTAKLELLFLFFEQIRVVSGCYEVHWGFPILL